MPVIVYKGRKQLELRPDEMPELDAEQVAAGDLMADNRAFLLWSDPGAGKTLTALYAMSVVWSDYNPNATVVVICPPIAIRTWARWIKAVCDMLGRSAIVQIAKNRKDTIRPDTTHLIVSYNMLNGKTWDNLKQQVKARKFDIAICDESDALTGWTSNTTRHILGGNFCNEGILEFCQWRWFLTGTPIPRYNDGVFPVLRANFKSRLEEFGVVKKGAFKNMFCRVRLVKHGRMRMPVEQVSGSKNNDKLKSLLFDAEPAICARLKLKLEHGYQERVIDLDVNFSKEFTALEEELSDIKYYDEAVVVDPRLATAMSMLGAESAPAAAAYAIDVLKSYRNRGVTQGLVVLFWHQAAGDILQAKLTEAGFKVGRIDGKSTQEQNAKVEDQINSGEIDICLGQIKSMGVALNMQENCRHVIFAEETFSNASNLQALQRVWRRGQTQPVMVDFCRPYSSLAEMKPRTSASKGKAAAEVLD